MVRSRSRTVDLSGPFAQDAISGGEAALMALSPRYMALPAERIERPLVNLRVAATMTLGVALRLKPSGPREPYERLSGCGMWNISHLDDLEPMSRAAWSAREQLDGRAATRTAVQIPEALVKDAEAVRARMRKVTEFHFEDDAELGALLAYLRRGTGYQDLADDLVGFARIYRTRHHEIETTPRFYKPTDLVDALRLSGEILETLGLRGDKELDALNDQVGRCFTLLRVAYDEVRAAGIFLERHNPAVAELFPSMYTAGRGGRSAPKQPVKPPSPP